MNKRSGHPYGTMAERIAATKAASAAPVPAAASPEPGARNGVGGLKHCWVLDAHGRLPALLLEWRRTTSGWHGRVVHPVPDLDSGGWVLVEEWLAASALDQA